MQRLSGLTAMEKTWLISGSPGSPSTAAGQNRLRSVQLDPRQRVGLKRAYAIPEDEDHLETESHVSKI